MSTSVKEQKKPFFFVDAGNLLSRQPRLPAAPSPERLTAEGIVAIYTAMQVDGVAVGPFDLSAGLDLLQSSHQQGFPWLSANLLDAAGKPLFSPYRIKKAGKIKAGIIGLTGGSSPSATALPDGISCAQWQAVLPNIIAKIGKQCDILILLSSLPPSENQEIARQFPAIHIIIAADPNYGNIVPQQIGNTILTQTDRQGKYQGMLTIDWHKNGTWGNSGNEQATGKDATSTLVSHKFFPLTPDLPEEPRIKEMVTTIGKNIEALRQRPPQSPSSTPAPPQNHP